MIKLNELIKKSGYQKEYIAKKMGVSIYTISHWVNGKTSPTLNQAQKLKEILNLDSIDQLIEEEENQCQQ
ncbi:MAG: helix-turn-helix domain-containing protein [Actinobacteria bacterium]|nr:helix-turn-helix domain-containing protein [Actinomycetota bacterium]